MRTILYPAQDLQGSPVLAHVKTILRLMPLSLALLLCGCGPGYTFSPWMGPQSNWTTGPGGYVRQVDGVPFFTSGMYPPRPYVILGAVTSDNEDNIAKAATKEHADAVLLLNESVRRTGSVAWAVPGVYAVTPLTKTTITADLIKYR